MDDWEEKVRGTGGVLLGVWIPRDPNYVKNKEQKVPEPPKAPAEDWIKVKVVDDQSGIVIEKVELDLKTPDGNTEKHTTRLSGEIESLGLQSGDCEISGDLNELNIGNTLLFVGTGDSPVGKPEEGKPKPEKIPPPPSGSKYRIAIVEEHKVKTGETLKSIASTANMRWEALAKFNWGTDDPDEVNKHLHLDVGCTKKSTDGKNYIFDDSDQPGILYVPKKWTKSGLATNQQHTVRVKPVISENKSLEVYDKDANDKPIQKRKFTLISTDGEKIKGECDDNGYCKIENIKSKRNWRIHFDDFFAEKS